MSEDEDFLNQLPGQLDAAFDVTGRFYSHIGGAETYKCRDLLEIRRRDAGACVEADAVFIMMNPGSSHPLGGDAEVELSDARLVPTKPDTTQYQLMRLMSAMGWQRVKVLNLSDLRVTRSADFFERVQEFEARESHDGHSLFAKSRRHELAPALSRRSDAPIVAAWGVDKALQKLAVAAQKALPSMPVLGLRHQNGPWAYRHPLPQTAGAQIQWRRDALLVLRAGGDST